MAQAQTHWYVELSPSLTSGPSLGKGSYGMVMPHPDYPKDWVIKKAKNDGTRTYLEWCHFMQHKKNRRLRGMPEVDWVVAQGTQQYIVCMRRYQPIWHAKEDKGGPLDMLKTVGWCDPEQIYALHQKEGCPGYLVKLVEVFERLWPRAVNDFHRGNLMFDKARNELILTDPSCREYRPLPTQEAKTYWNPEPLVPELTLE